jgi:hypothetical protein
VAATSVAIAPLSTNPEVHADESRAATSSAITGSARESRIDLFITTPP